MRIIVTINFSNISVSPGFYGFFFSVHARILAYEIMFFIQVLHNFIVKTALGRHNSLKQFIKLKFIGKIFNVTVGLRQLTHNSNKHLPTKKSIKNSEN